MKYVKTAWDRTKWPPQKWIEHPDWQMEFIRAISTISVEKKFIFIHTGRTGGNAMHRGVFEKVIPDVVNSVNLEKPVNDVKWKDFFKFTFVRNPWDKMVSAYYLKKYGAWHVPLESLPPDVDFEYFIKNVAWDKEGTPRNYHWIEQQLAIKSVVDGSIWVDFIGKFENIENGWKTVCEKIGINEKLPHTNENRRKLSKPYQEYYNDETRAIVEEKFKRDIEMFGYSFN